jgi:cation diffusion facilitator CzcD-associated flavoprotein CzcO
VTTPQPAPAAPPATTGPTHVDVLVVGAGISGIGAAYHLRRDFPERSFAVLDALDGAGGTWWTHRYPGARSDSDLFTFGYSFKPWRGPSIATAGEIRAYLEEVVEENGLGEHIRHGHKVTTASWSSEDARWTVEAVRTGTTSPSGSPRTSCGCARATTATTPATCPTGPAWTASAARWCTPSTGPRTWTGPASGSW